MGISPFNDFRRKKMKKASILTLAAALVMLMAMPDGASWIRSSTKIAGIAGKVGRVAGKVGRIAGKVGRVAVRVVRVATFSATGSVGKVGRGAGKVGKFSKTVARTCLCPGAKRFTGTSVAAAVAAATAARAKGKPGLTTSRANCTCRGVKGTAETWAGIGARASFKAGYKDGKLKFRAGTGAALGVGAGGKVQVEVDVKKLGNMAGRGARR